MRENFAPVDSTGHKCAPRDAAFVVLTDGAQVYRDGTRAAPLAEYAQSAFDGIKWRPSIFMPRWASRITLEVTDVRVERLLDISEEDAIAEGIARKQVPTFFDGPGSTWLYEADGEEFATAKTAFEFLWDGINSKRAPAESNPWVWCISFRRLDEEGAA